MANRTKGFTLTAKTRPTTGARYWLVRGTRDGRQLRREFNNRADALVFIENQNSEANGTAPKQSHLLTHLSTEDLRAAEAIVQQLQRDFPSLGLFDLLDYYRNLAESFSLEEAKRIGPAIRRLKKKYPQADLAIACDWFADNYRPPKNSLTLQIALEHYAVDVNRRFETKTLSRPHYRRIGYAMSELENYFGSSEPLANITSGRLKDYMLETTHGKHDASFSNKTWNNRRGYLTAFFEFCLGREWLEVNPAMKIQSFRKNQMPHPPPAVFTLARARELMHFLEGYRGGRLVPYYAVCLFGGIRPDWNDGEISKITLDLFNFEERALKLPALKAKPRNAREVVLQPNLIAWLEAYPLEQFPIKATNFKKLHLQVRKQFKLEHDVLRHTYCSMLVGKFRSVADAALQAGNSERVLWSNYLNLSSRKEAEAFWEIMPSRRGIGAVTAC